MKAVQDLGIVLGCVLLCSVDTMAQTSAPRVAVPVKAQQGASDPLKRMAASVDKMRDVTYYQHPSSPKYVNSPGFFLYFGKSQSGSFTPLRLVARYFGDDWLFVSEAFAKADGVRVGIPTVSGRLGWERDNSDGNVYEWSDKALTTPQDIAAVRQLANAKSVTVRFEGRQYYKDRTLTSQQLGAMRDTISAYEAATGKPWK